MFTVIALAVALVVTLAVGKPVIRWLQRMKAGQQIKEDGPVWHMSKQGTPTMGGCMFIIGIVAALLVAGWQSIRSGDGSCFLIFIFALLYGLVGMVDDMVKIRKKQNAGLTALQKFILQLVVAIAFICLLRLLGYLTPNLFVPFCTKRLVLAWPIYLILLAFISVGGVNAVNLTDGVDGLVSCVTLPVAVFFALAGAFLSCHGAGVYAGALAGGLIGFLCFNFHPAKVFMGDTGSLFLGGSVVGLAFVCDMPLILIPVGIIYIAETVSDILQVGYFKLTHGKRIFRMAPLHHHLEMGGWSERKICFVFAGITIVFCVLAWFGIRTFMR